MPPKPPVKQKSQSAPKVGLIGPSSPMSQYPPVPLKNTPTNQAYTALESLASGTNTPAPIQQGSTAGEPAQRVTIYPYPAPGAGGNKTGIIETAESLRNLGSAPTTPGTALDIFLAKIIAQNEEQDKRIKALEGAIAELKAIVAGLSK